MRLDPDKIQLAMANAKPPLTQKELAIKAGMIPNALALTMGRARAGSQQRPDLIGRLAKALGVKAEMITVAE